MRIEEGKLIYHLTDIANLENIIKYGLLSRKELQNIGLLFKNVADPEIIGFRRTPRHPLNMSPFMMYTYEAGMKEIDWETMNKCSIVK